jgi:hypothetical protein
MEDFITIMIVSLLLAGGVAVSHSTGQSRRRRPAPRGPEALKPTLIKESP